MAITLKKRVLFLFLLGFLATQVQPYQKAATMYSTASKDVNSCIDLTNDGHYYLTWFSQGSPWSVEFRKISGTDLSQLWTYSNHCPTTGLTLMVFCAKSMDGSIMVLGWRNQNCIDTNPHVAYVMKVSASGAFSWLIEYTGVIIDFRHITNYESDSGFIVSGISPSSTGMIVRIDSAGTVLYQATWSHANSECWQALYLSDGTVWQIGFVNQAPTVCHVKKYSGTMGLLWEKNWGANGGQICFAVAKAATGNFFVSGETAYGLGGLDAFLLKLDDSGNLLWQNGYGGAGTDQNRGIIALGDGTMALVGYTLTNSPVSALWIVNLDESTGNQISSWTDTAHQTGPVAIGIHALFVADRVIAIPANFDVSSTNNEDVMIIVMEPPCQVGSRTSDTNWGCTLCAAGTYQDVTGQTTCKTCTAGTYQTQTGKTSCVTCEATKYCTTTASITCPAGTEQPNTGKSLLADCTHCATGSICISGGCSACTACLPGTYDDSNGVSACKDCAEGTYQDLASQTACKTCSAHDYPNAAKTACLIQGIFVDTPTFTASPMSTACYDGSSNIIIPFPTTCRTAYRSVCCDGATKKASVNCNFGLGALSVAVSMHDKYCSACTFQDQTKCPANGVCWDDTTWVSNAASPYPADFTQACYTAVKDYCKPRLQANTNDPECAPFTAKCGSMITTNSYGTLWNKFRITFTKPLPATLSDCNTMFDTNSAPNAKTGTLTCTRVSDTEMDVDVSKLTNGPIISYKLNANSFFDYCGFDLPTTTTYTVTSPTVDPLNPFETFKIAYTPTNDKCKDLVVTSSIQVFFCDFKLKEIVSLVNSKSILGSFIH